MADSTPEQQYRLYLETLGEELERRHPGCFQWHFGKPSTNVIEGLIITKGDVSGYVFVGATSSWPGGRQGGVWREDAEHAYSASIMKHREWEHEGMSHSGAIYLESRCSAQPDDIIDWLCNDWAFDRPWQPAPAVDLSKQRRALQKLADGLGNRSNILVRIDVDIDAHLNLTSEAEGQLEADVENLATDRIRNLFPSDKRGLLALRTTVLLAQYETTQPPARWRELCLVAEGPARRADRQEIVVRLEPLIPLNQDHVWEYERWRWQTTVSDSQPALRWGSDVSLDRITTDPQEIADLRSAADAGTISDGDKAALAISLQDAGQLLEAMALYDVEVEDDLQRLCGGQKIYPPACCAYADETWTTRWHDWLRSCAPWLLAHATRREAQRIATWAAAKKSRQRRLPVLKLLIFPGQHHSRKASLVLTAVDLAGTRPLLEIQATASNTRLHDSGWRRPLELDFVRHHVNVD